MTRAIFVGNRFNVLKEILNTDIKIVDIFCPKGSILEKELINRGIEHKILSSKELFCETIKKMDFDILISNGLPFKIPVSKIKKIHQIFINIHPSILPDLKGINPINGAILFGKDSGATCHVMDDDIDSGAVIEQIKIKLTSDLDLGLLYQLCFMAEAEVFKKAYAKKFVPSKFRKSSKNYIYFTRKETDLSIDFLENKERIIRRIKAFGIKSQGANFTFRNNVYKVLDVEEIKNDYLLNKLDAYKELEIAFVYENNVVIKKRNCFIKLKNIIGDINALKPGVILKDRSELK